MKGASKMKAKRWTLGVVLVAAVSLWGLVEADASPFSSYILSDDLGNMVRGSAAEATAWDDESGSEDTGGTTDSGGNTGNGSGSTDSGSESASSTGDTASGGVENDGHGNNADGVDSSNKGASKTGEDTLCADGAYCDDEIKTTGNTKK
jgi:hypothetical protein